MTPTISTTRSRRAVATAASGVTPSRAPERPHLRLGVEEDGGRGEARAHLGQRHAGVGHLPQPPEVAPEPEERARREVAVGRGRDFR